MSKTDGTMRVYKKSEVAHFMRSKEKHGALSNMCGGFPMELCGIRLQSIESYYQAMRYTRRPDFQKRVLAGTNGMLAKRIAYESDMIGETRPDWQNVNIALMRHALRLKYAHHPHEITRHLDETGEMPIVELSWKDQFWGARPDRDMLRGENVLGRLWMELRAEVVDHDPDAPYLVKAPNIPDCILCGHVVSDMEFSSVSTGPEYSGPGLE